jgi:hypothetical protein
MATTLCAARSSFLKRTENSDRFGHDAISVPLENELNKYVSPSLTQRTISNDDFAATCRRSHSSRNDHFVPAMWQRGCAHHLDKEYSKRDAKGAGVSLRCACDANDRSGHRFTRDRYSSMGKLLSLALPSLLGIGVLFFGEQLCNGRVW